MPEVAETTLITGVRAGTGRELALAFAKHGFQVAGCAGSSEVPRKLSGGLDRATRIGESRRRRERWAHEPPRAAIGHAVKAEPASFEAFVLSSGGAISIN